MKIIATTTGPFTADNITPKAIDLIAFILKEQAAVAEEIWRNAQYGEISPATGADLINELIQRVQLTFTP